MPAKKKKKKKKKKTPSTHHPQKRNVTTLMVGLKNGHIRKNLTQKVVNPRDIAGERKKKKKKAHGHGDVWHELGLHIRFENVDSS